MVARLGGEAGWQGSADTQVQPLGGGDPITLRLKTDDQRLLLLERGQIHN